MSKKIVIISCLIILLVLFSTSSYQRFTSADVTPAASYATATPIKHVVIIMQENHAFDNMFGTFPGLPSAFAENLNTCMPNPGGSPSCIKPWNANSKSSIQATDIPHTRSAALKAYDNGKMDGFVKDMPSGEKNYGMAYYTGSAIPYYWDYASYFSFNYNFFSSSMSYSLPNHLFAVAAQAGTYASTCLTVCESEYNLTFPQIGQSLTNAGIPWGYYQENWNDAINCPTTPYTRAFINAHGHTGGYDGLWAGLTQFTQVQMTAVECSSLGNLKDLQNAINSNNLPAVSWVEPQPTSSDHPGQSTWINGEKYVSSLINLIEHSSAWSSTVIYLTWDDWGGYYDNVIPTQLDAAGDGFRVPLIAISPYSTGQMVQGPSQEDFSAFLSTIEYNWGLSPIASRDASESNLFYMLNFNQTPLKPLVLASSGVTYPLSSCSSPACTYSATNIPQPSSVYVPNTTNNESVSQALAYSGNDDPGD
jgi:phospholipase C